jgi:hypothetical protein
MNVMAQYRMSAEGFAKANGWSVGKQFSIKEIAWPTEEEMAEMAAAYARVDAVKGRDWAATMSSSRIGPEF